MSHLNVKAIYRQVQRCGISEVDLSSAFSVGNKPYFFSVPDGPQIKTTCFTFSGG